MASDSFTKKIIVKRDNESAVLEDISLLRQRAEKHIELIIAKLRSGKKVILIITFTEYKT
ncbi:MAG: hypothetical protein AYP45_01560 [Candidatus Brocadia carolinensis]|uniref:Uncharacterized protein n=1 Tax=Candidatus Brocadia carolinensis TaxID=1004156 RepID=A0A1V4AXB3_9BACT|nr:MAG: hypothetical protein AYP45_01560 [Candidatus Brocadia caroliniensis]